MPKKLDLPTEPMFKGPAIVWKRLAAFFIDISILYFVIGSVFNSTIYERLPKVEPREIYSYVESHPRLALVMGLFVIISGFLALLYFSILEYHLGQTPGKMLMNIRVEQDSRDKSYFSFIVRSLFLVFIPPFPLFIIADPLFIIFSKDQRRLSEILSRTRTVEFFYLGGG